MTHDLPAKEKYDVIFINDFEEFDEPHVVKFTAYSEGDVRSVIEALSSHNSGDPCTCFINGQEAVLEKDWGLM